MTDDPLVDPETLRQQVRDKYRDVALDPHAEHHFHTGRPLAGRLGSDPAVVDRFLDWGDQPLPNKQAAFAEIHRVLRPGGTLQFADIANGRPVPLEALRDVDLWTA